MRLSMRAVDLLEQKEIIGREKDNHTQKPEFSSRRPHSPIQVRSGGRPLTLQQHASIEVDFVNNPPRTIPKTKRGIGGRIGGKVRVFVGVRCKQSTEIPRPKPKLYV
ncbi:hypothetical protein LXL04_002442 [Taraxacum kok-saghyz]